MNVVVTISCASCCKSVTAYILPDQKKNYQLSYWIESEAKGFKCDANDEGSMKVTCSCGNEINMCLQWKFNQINILLQNFNNYMM